MSLAGSITNVTPREPGRAILIGTHQHTGDWSTNLLAYMAYVIRVFRPGNGRTVITLQIGGGWMSDERQRFITADPCDLDGGLWTPVIVSSESDISRGFLGNPGGVHALMTRHGQWSRNEY